MFPQDKLNLFKAKAGAESTWQWYAKELNENDYPMRFPNAKITDTEHITIFTELKKRTVPSISFTVGKWNAAASAKGCSVVQNQRHSI